MYWKTDTDTILDPYDPVLVLHTRDPKVIPINANDDFMEPDLILYHENIG